MTASRREVLRRLLAGVFQAGGAAVVVVSVGSLRAGDETPLPELDLTVQQPPTRGLDQRVERAAAGAEDVPPPTGEEDSWINGGFRNAGFRNGGFANGGGFRNSGFGNVPGPGGFRNSAFRNW